MGKKSRIIAILLALAMAIPMAACSSGNDTKEDVSSSAASTSASESSSEESTADESTAAESSEEKTTDNVSSEAAPSTDAAETTSESLKGVFDALLKNEGYKEYKGYSPNTTFEEKLVGDSIVIKVSGSDGVEGTCTFPYENGFLICNATPDDYLSSVIYSVYITSSIADYYGINSALYVGYTSYMGETDNEDYIVDMKEDGTGTIKINIDKKPDVSVLDEVYVTEEVASKYYDEEYTNFTLNYGKILLNSTIDKEQKSFTMAIGEFGDQNTEITYNSIRTIVNIVKPAGYEDFLKDFTELKEIKNDKYSVSFDSESFAKETDMELNSNYKFVIVKVGA